MKISKELITPGLFTLLTAPVASGKTRMVVEFYSEQQVKIIYLSPLRALANEVYANLKKREMKNVFLAGGELAIEDVLHSFLSSEKAFLVTTPELLSDEFMETLGAQKEQVLVVIDEFHLFYYWGRDFRPILLDKFHGLLHLDFPILAVTATIEKSVADELRSDLLFHYEKWCYLDFGNHQLHRLPTQLKSFSGLKVGYLQRTFWREMRNKEKKEIYLYFCSYRSQVDELVMRAKRMGFTALGCVGGEVESFLGQLAQSEKQLDCIFATTTLSHGVNLPEIKKVFIDYEVKNYDFWLQMIGRGGRRGSAYEVYTCDQYHKTTAALYLDKTKIILADFIGIEL